MWENVYECGVLYLYVRMCGYVCVCVAVNVCDMCVGGGGSQAETERDVCRGGESMCLLGSDPETKRTPYVLAWPLSYAQSVVLFLVRQVWWLG